MKEHHLKTSHDMLDAVERGDEMSEPGKRADGGVHTWMQCPDCKTAIRASRHSAEDCDSLFALRAELTEVKRVQSESAGCTTAEENDAAGRAHLGDPEC